MPRRCTKHSVLREAVGSSENQQKSSTCLSRSPLVTAGWVAFVSFDILALAICGAAYVPELRKFMETAPGGTRGVIGLAMSTVLGVSALSGEIHAVIRCCHRSRVWNHLRRNGSSDRVLVDELNTAHV